MNLLWKTMPLTTVFCFACAGSILPADLQDETLADAQFPNTAIADSPFETPPDAATPDAMIVDAPTNGEMILVDDPLNASTVGAIDGNIEFIGGGGVRSTGGKIIFDAGEIITNGRVVVVGVLMGELSRVLPRFSTS